MSYPMTLSGDVHEEDQIERPQCETTRLFPHRNSPVNGTWDRTKGNKNSAF